MARADAKTVLIIDDSAAIREQVRSVLQPAGYQVIEARDGLEGMEKIKANRELGLVLCDLTMPGMGGLAVVQAAQNAGLTVPFLVLTSDGQPSVIRRARDAGVKGWIVKPIKADMLRFAVDKILTVDVVGLGTGPDAATKTQGRS